jgi:hypothetical protein
MLSHAKTIKILRGAEIPAALPPEGTRQCYNTCMEGMNFVTRKICLQTFPNETHLNTSAYIDGLEIHKYFHLWKNGSLNRHFRKKIFI